MSNVYWMDLYWFDWSMSRLIDFKRSCFHSNPSNYHKFVYQSRTNPEPNTLASANSRTLDKKTTLKHRPSFRWTLGLIEQRTMKPAELANNGKRWFQFEMVRNEQFALHQYYERVRIVANRVPFSYFLNDNYAKLANTCRSSHNFS